MGTYNKTGTNKRIMHKYDLTVREKKKISNTYN